MQLAENAVGHARPGGVVPGCPGCPGCRLYFLHSTHEHIGCLRMGVNGNKDGFLKKAPFYSSKKSFGKSPTFPTPIP